MFENPFVLLRSQIAITRNKKFKEPDNHSSLQMTDQVMVTYHIGIFNIIEVTR